MEFSKNKSHYSKYDGFLLMVINCNRKKIDFLSWYSTMDYIDRCGFGITYEEMENSIKRLIAGGLIYVKDCKVIVTETGKQLLKKSHHLFIGIIDWQIKLSNLIVNYTYDINNLPNEKILNSEDFKEAQEKYIKSQLKQ